MKRLILRLILYLGILGIGFINATNAAAKDSITLLATTSVENSGFLDYILPLFEADSGIGVKAVIAGSGAAIQSGKRGNGDVLLTHSPKDEAAFIAENWGVERLPFMYNEFVIIGHSADTANIAAAASVEEAFRRIAKARATFVSRSDNSGTDRREKAIWQAAGIHPEKHSGTWYWQSGSGMSSAFNIATASSTGAYVFGDSATWARFGNKRDHKILFADSTALKNQYVLMAVNPARHKHIKHKQAQIFIDWLLSAKGQSLISAYKIAGQPLFTANAAAR